MTKWIFTFCGNQEFYGYVQPIFAPDYGTARDIMFAKYGDKWGFQYTWDEYCDNKNRFIQNGYYEIELELSPLYYEEEEIIIYTEEKT